MADLFVSRTAEWSGETHPIYRLVLRIVWDDTLPMLVALLANPSKASEHVSDPTVDRVEERARRRGFGGVIILNAFAFRATDPADMFLAAEPVGAGNNACIRCVLKEAKANGWTTLLGWGEIGRHRNRHLEVARILKEEEIEPVCLHINTKSGQPTHPLYLAYDLPFQPWPFPA